MKANKKILLFFALVFSIVVRANDSVWIFNPYDYQYDMTVYIGISSLDGKSVPDASNYHIGAFCGDECRGIAEAKVVGDKTYLYLRVRSNVSTGEVIRFKVRNLESGKTATAKESVEFNAQQTLGYPSTPYTINAVNQYTISFDTDGGSEVAPITQDYNTAVTAPADPTKAGYTFAGWDKEIPGTIPAENITIKAHWTINQYKVTFIADGIVISEETLDYGSPVTVPEAPNKEGYTFVNWGEVDETVPAHDVVYVANYEVNYYTLTYILDGEVYAEFDVAFGETIIPLEINPAEGRLFEGWQEVPVSMPSHDVKVYGTTVATDISVMATEGLLFDVYTLGGILVKKNVNVATLRSTLDSGIYIINGKKIKL